MCSLKSFSFLLSGAEQFSFPEANVAGPSGDFNWKYSSTNSPSTFQVQGFKNINIFKVEAVGHIYSEQNTEVSIVSDWAFYLQLNGQNAPVIGNVVSSPNGWAMVTESANPVIALSRYNTSVEFTTPVVSVNSLQILRLIAQGVGAQASALNIAWHMTFIIHYTFEGEEFAFL